MTKEDLKEEDLIKDLIEINRRLSYDLWNVSCFNKKPSGLSPRLIFPVNRINGEIRISEQEARILYCNILNNLNYFYSIETPTKETFQQTGNTPLSALFDLSIYKFIDGSFEKKVNIELKAHNPALKNFSKDIEKIIREGKDGNWFHVLKNIDKATLPSVFDKFISSLKEHSDKSNKISILFCICVLEKKWGMIKHFEWNNKKGNLIDYLDNFFILSQIRNRNTDEQKEFLRNNEWLIVES